MCVSGFEDQIFCIIVLLNGSISSEYLAIYENGWMQLWDSIHRHLGHLAGRFFSTWEASRPTSVIQPKKDGFFESSRCKRSFIPLGMSF